MAFVCHYHIMSSKGKLTYKEKSSIHYVQSAEPKFIQQLKQQLGYKAPATIEDKVIFLSHPVFMHLVSYIQRINS